MELSRFTVTKKVAENRVALFNTHTKALVSIPSERLRDLNNGEGPLEIRENLERLGILVHSREQEFKDFLNFYETIQHSGHVGIWLYLTSDCNLGCPYCYQGLDKPEIKLNRFVVKKLVEKIKELQNPYDEKSLTVTFYGGEPLLNKEVLDETLDIFNDEFREMPRNYYMITNGTKLNNISEVKRWREKGLNGLQITLDGTKEEHDSRRIRLEGKNKGTFDEILNNIQLAKDLIPVDIRINYDEGNVDQISTVIDILKDKKLNVDNISINFAAIFDSDRSDYADEQSLTSAKDEIGYLDSLMRYANDKGFNVAMGFEGPCTIRNFSGLVVYPNGDLYSCPGMSGIPDYKWGNVFTKIDYKRQKEIVYEGIYPECKTCPVLPVCAGGCEWEEIVQTGKQGRHCDYTNLMRKVKLHIEHKIDFENGVSTFTQV